MKFSFSTRSVAWLAAMLFSVNTLPVYAVSSGSGAASSVINGSASEKLSQLEVRFFEHPYGNDNVDGRLNRLELFVFGAKRSGSDDNRLASLIAALPTAKVAAKPAEESVERPVEKPIEKSPSKSSANPFAKRSAKSPNVPAVADHDSYPDTAYGAPPQAPQYSEPDPQPFSQDSYPSAAPANYPRSAPSSGVEATISDLEQQITGQTHKQQSLNDRVAALEDIVSAPNADHSGSIVHRVARLQNAVGSAATNNAAPTYSAPPVDYKQAYTSQSQPVPKMPKEHPMLRTAAKTALVVGAVAGVAALTIMASRGMGGGSLGSASRLIRLPRRDLF